MVINHARGFLTLIGSPVGSLREQQLARWHPVELLHFIWFYLYFNYQRRFTQGFFFELLLRTFCFFHVKLLELLELDGIDLP
jgi:hypothetical protein